MTRRAIVLFVAVTASCRSGPRYLDAKLPAACTARDTDSCLGWLSERDLASELEIFDAPALRGYAQSIANRLVRGSRTLTAPPRIILTDRGGTYATHGNRIVIARRTIEKLSSEAELAAVIAHELVHVEGRHASASLFGPRPDDDLATRRDVEAIADERAVWLLDIAGYPPSAMASALAAVLEDEDAEHPLRADRIARARVIARGRDGGRLAGREAFLAQLAGMPVGRNPRLGIRVANGWVVPELAVTFELAVGDRVRSDSDVLALRTAAGDDVVAYAVGAGWGRELARELVGRTAGASDHGQWVRGNVPEHDHKAITDPLVDLLAAVRATLPQPKPGSHIAILLRDHGALVFEISRPDLALAVRAATANELAAAAPARVMVVRASRAGAIGQLDACPIMLDDPARYVVVGDPIKCADRQPR